MDENSKFYIEASREQAREYDSRVFWLSGGAIALSGAFLQTLLARTGAIPLQGVWILPSSWGVLIVAIIVVMLGLQVSMEMCSRWVRFLEMADPKSAARAVKLATVVNVLNYVALALVVLGIGGVGWFVCLNLPL